jgi:hypothetical protein
VKERSGHAGLQDGGARREEYSSEKIRHVGGDSALLGGINREEE